MKYHYWNIFNLLFTLLLSAIVLLTYLVTGNRYLLYKVFFFPFHSSISWKIQKKINNISSFVLLFQDNLNLFYQKMKNVITLKVYKNIKISCKIFYQSSKLDYLVVYISYHYFWMSEIPTCFIFNRSKTK